MTRAVVFRVHNTSIGLWQDNSNDPTWSREIYGGVIRHVRDCGWSIRRDAEVSSRYRSLSPSHREGARGDLRCSIELMGRSIKIEFWARTWPIDNRNGRRFDFNKLERMEYLDRLRFRIETKHMLAWLENRAKVQVEDNEQIVAPGQLSAREAIERDYAISWHTDKKLGRPVPGGVYNCTSADGNIIEHDSIVWFVDRDGRIGRGTAHYHINNMWWVVSGRWSRRNLSTSEIFTQPPSDLRRKRNERRRRGRLEDHLATAIRRMDFDRAATLKRILFGDAAPWMIWARDHQAYYRSNYSGYTTDTIAAGRYTREEAEREARRVPHELEVHGPNGERLRFDRAAA